MTLIYGNFRQDLNTSEQFLVISFAPSSIPLQQRWRNNGLSADFVADYLVAFFPVDENDSQSLNRQANLKGAVSYIANELLENAMKYHEETVNSAITFGIHLLGQTVILFSTNCVAKLSIPSLTSAIEELLSSDLEILYIEKLEALAEENNMSESGMGLLTIIHDYGAEIGWKLEELSSNSELSRLTTMVQIQF
ncbi:MAG: DUF6272 family protein [Microcystaceae cyanobacterium]